MDGLGALGGLVGGLAGGLSQGFGSLTFESGYPAGYFKGFALSVDAIASDPSLGGGWQSMSLGTMEMQTNELPAGGYLRTSIREIERINEYMEIGTSAFGPDFISTINQKARERGKPERLPTLEETIMMKQMAIDLLAQHGYHENLRRVFSRERNHYSHYADNQCCGLLDQLGFGLTAFSSLRDRFALNTQDFTNYYAMISEGKLPPEPLPQAGKPQPPVQPPPGVQRLFPVGGIGRVGAVQRPD
jgi:hypothetical protein